MKTSSDGRALIEAFEGRYLEAYQDSVGVWTIGYGHTTVAGLPYVTAGMKITETDADRILAVDLSKVEKQVLGCIKSPLNQAQFDALVSFTFNLGQGNLSRSNLSRRVNAGDYDVSKEFLKWDLAGGHKLDGLTRRRKAESLMWGGDVAGALALAGVKHALPDVEPAPKPKPKPHVASGSAGAATGAALHILGLPLWAVLSAAFVVALVVYLIIRSKK